MTLTGRAALAAVAAVAVIVAFPAAVTLLAVNVVILAALGADLVLAASPRALRVSRSGQARIHLRESGTVTLSVVNQGRRPLRAVVRDGWRPSAGARPPRFAIDLAPGHAATLTTTLVPHRRGDVAGGLVTVRSLGPLGLAARQRSLPAPWTVRVLPEFASRRYLPEKLARLRELDGQHRSLLRGQGSEFDSLRAYVLGDDVRSIDWRSSARRGDVLVRTWRPERDRRIIIAVDTGRTAAGRVAGVPRLDACMDAALLLSAVAIRAGDRVDLIAADRRVRTQIMGAARNEALAAFTSELALLEADLVEPDIGLLTATVLQVAAQRCLVVLLTDLSPAAMEQGLLPHVRLLSARHQLMVAAVADPRLAEMARDHSDATAIYGAAAAVRAESGRAHVSALLRRHGVEVVDAPPDQLAPALTDAYLNLKSAGRL